MGFVSIYESNGQYALAGYAAFLTIAFAQVCFQAAACGCAQRCSDDSKNRAEWVGHILLAGLSFPAMAPIPYMGRYVVENDLLDTVALNFMLTKGGSMVGALFLMSMLWYILWRMQSAVDGSGHGRMGSDGAFYIQWDDPDVLDYWLNNPEGLPDGFFLALPEAACRAGEDTWAGRSSGGEGRAMGGGGEVQEVMPVATTLGGKPPASGCHDDRRTDTAMIQLETVAEGESDGANAARAAGYGCMAAP